jgi:hypothetical protein
VVLPDGPNQRWSLDFVSDTLTCSRRFRILCVVDNFTLDTCWPVMAALMKPAGAPRPCLHQGNPAFD